MISALLPFLRPMEASPDFLLIFCKLYTRNLYPFMGGAENSISTALRSDIFFHVRRWTSVFAQPVFPCYERQLKFLLRRTPTKSSSVL